MSPAEPWGSRCRGLSSTLSPRRGRGKTGGGGGRGRKRGYRKGEIVEEGGGGGGRGNAGRGEMVEEGGGGRGDAGRKGRNVGKRADEGDR